VEDSKRSSREAGDMLVPRAWSDFSGDVEKETKSKWCNSKNHLRQGERLQSGSCPANECAYDTEPVTTSEALL